MNRSGQKSFVPRFSRWQGVKVGPILSGLAWTFLFLALAVLPALAESTSVGDLDGDNQTTVLDLVRLINHINGTTPLAAAKLPFADINGDSFVDQSDVDGLADLILGIPIPPKPVTMEPATGAAEVGVTVRPKVFFPRPVDISTLSSNNFYASFAGRKLPATIVPAANNGTFAWLFFDPAMPNASQITVSVDGSTITNQVGMLLDAEGNGNPGGVIQFNFSTVSVAPIPGTVVTSLIVDPGPDLIPRTADDVSLGNGFNYLLPIRGVKVYVLGMENNVAYTDATGRFTLTNMPVGDVKVVLDGRTATNAPSGYYFPEMVMDTTFEPGITNGVMNIVDTNGVVVRDANGVPIRAIAMYLPRIASNILQTISATNTTLITLRSNAAYNLPTNQQPYLTVQIQSNSLVGMNGQPLSSAQIGISVVPPELVRDMLPPGLLQHTFDITVQAPGVATFATPAPMSFPNVFNAPPGTKLNFVSFDHTTGRLVIEGTATVSDDGLFVRTDPGTGITHPGWHGLTPPGSWACAPPGPPPKDNNCMLSSGSSFGPCPENPSDIQKARARCALGGINVAACALAWQACDIACDHLLPEIPIPSVHDLLSYFVCGKLCDPLLQKCKRDMDNARCCFQFYDDCLLRLGDQTVPEPDQGGSLQDCSCPCPVGSIGGNNNNSLNDFDSNLQRLGQFFDFAAEASGVVGVKTNVNQFTTNELNRLQLLGQQLSNLVGPAGPSAFLIATAQRLKELADVIAQKYDVFAREAASYSLEDLTTGFPLRGKTETGGSIASIFISPNTQYRLRRVFPGTLTFGEVVFTSSSSGQRTQIPRGGWTTDESGDTDSDGLTDQIEFVLGTDPSKWSTAGDGISDQAKIQQGLDPLSGRGFPSGVIASLPLPGEAKEVVLEGSILDSQTQTAYLALGSRGLGIVNASQFQKPILLGQLALSGDAVDVAVDSNLRIAGVAANAGGLHFVNVADPMNPALWHTFNINATELEVMDGMAYVASGTLLLSYDLVNRERVQVLAIGNANITGLAREGSFLYAMDSALRLRVIDLSGASMVARGSLIMPAGGRKLFVGNGVAYVAAETGPTGGFATADVSNPDNPALLSGVDANNVAGRAVVANGSGLAITVGNPGALGNALYVMDVSSPTNTGRFVTLFPLPGSPFSIAIGSGIAFVADGEAGLQVVNYLPFDNKGIAPMVTITKPPSDLDPATPGIQVQEGSFVHLQAQISDDVQVRNVELLVNGQAVQNDVSFPFDLSAPTPLLASGSTNVELRVRATDTGGNIGVSTPITVQLVSDTFPPSLVSIDPPNGAVRGQNFRAVTVRFSEAMDPASISGSSIALTGPGGLVLPQTIQLLNSGATVQLVYPALAAGGYQIALNGTAIRDRAGNALGTTNLSTFEIREATSVWSNPLGGVWDDPANWDGGVLPGTNDDVLIDVPGDVTVTYRQGTTFVRNLRIKNPFLFNGGTLVVSNILEIDNTFTFNGGTLRGATVVYGPNGQALAFANNGNNVLDHVTVNGDLNVAGVGSQVACIGGLVLNGTAYIGNLTNDWSAVLRVEGSLTGLGTVVFGKAAGGVNLLQVLSAGTTLTIGPGITIRGNNGAIGFSPVAWGGSPNVGVVNQGTIMADVAGGTIQINAQPFINQGMLKATAGTLDVNGITGNVGNALVSGGGHLDLDGNFINDQDRVVVGSTLSFRGNWTNAANIYATNAMVNWGGTFTLGTLGTFVRSSGTVNVVGTLNNSNTVLMLDGAANSWVLDGGTILGGTVVTTNGARLICANSQNQQRTRLDGVTVNGDLDIGLSTGFQCSSPAYLAVTNGLMLNGTAYVGSPSGASAGSFVFEGSQSFTGNGTVLFGLPEPNNPVCNSSYNLLWLRTPGSTVTFGPNIVVRGASGFISAGLNDPIFGAPSAGLVNLGTISGISISANPLINYGLLRGPITVGTTIPSGGLGAFDSSGGAVQLAGLLENTGNNVLLNGPSNILTLAASTIRGGTVTTTNGARLTGPGSSGPARLDSVTVNGELDFTQSGSLSRLIVTNGLVLNGTAYIGDRQSFPFGRTLRFEGSQTLSGTGTVGFVQPNFAGLPKDSLAIGPAFDGTTVTIEAGITITGRNGTIGYSRFLSGSISNVSVINKGTIAANAPDGTIYVAGQTFTNQGVLTAQGGGALTIDSRTWNNESIGRLNGLLGGTLSLNNAWNNAGSLNLTNATLNLGGVFTPSNVGTLNALSATVNLTGLCIGSNATLALDGTPWTLDGGAVRGGTIVTTNGARLICANNVNNVLDGVTLNGDLDLTGTHLAQTTITNGLVLNGTALVGHASTNAAGALHFQSNQTLDGNGVVVFGNSISNALRVTLDGTALTNGPSMTVRGQNGQIGYSSFWSGPTNVSFVNTGTVSADVAGGTIIVRASPFTNLGTTNELNGGILLINP